MAETLGLVAAAAGVALVYAAVTNQNPIAELRAALTTGDTSGSERITRQLGGVSVTATPGAVTDTRTPDGRPLTLVPIGQGNHRLQAPAVVKFGHWQRDFGQLIPVSDSYRSADQQAGAYASDPSRFGSPETSKHVLGLAVDVDLAAIGANPRGTVPQQWLMDPVYMRLWQTAMVNGWCNYQVRNNSTGGRTAEPWHFSFATCG